MIGIIPSPVKAATAAYRVTAFSLLVKRVIGTNTRVYPMNATEHEPISYRADLSAGMCIPRTAQVWDPPTDRWPKRIVRGTSQRWSTDYLPPRAFACRLFLYFLVRALVGNSFLSLETSTNSTFVSFSNH